VQQDRIGQHIVDARDDHQRSRVQRGPVHGPGGGSSAARRTRRRTPLPVHNRRDQARARRGSHKSLTDAPRKDGIRRD
jgi:hypothetical protein